MNDSTRTFAAGWRMAMAAVAVAMLGGLAGWYWQARSAGPDAAAAPADRAAIEKVVRDYILAHPEILPQAMENLQKRETAKQLAGAGDSLEDAVPRRGAGQSGGQGDAGRIQRFRLQLLPVRARPMSPR